MFPFPKNSLDEHWNSTEIDGNDGNTRLFDGG